jgi:hypothetical protein
MLFQYSLLLPLGVEPEGAEKVYVMDVAIVLKLFNRHLAPVIQLNVRFHGVIISLKIEIKQLEQMKLGSENCLASCVGAYEAAT